MNVRFVVPRVKRLWLFENSESQKRRRRAGHLRRGGRPSRKIQPLIVDCLTLFSENRLDAWSFKDFPTIPKRSDFD